MEYVIAIVGADGRRVISRHQDKQEAFEAGKQAWEKDALKGEVVICISGNISDGGTIKGQYRLYEVWR